MHAIHREQPHRVTSGIYDVFISTRMLKRFTKLLKTVTEVSDGLQITQTSFYHVGVRHIISDPDIIKKSLVPSGLLCRDDGEWLFIPSHSHMVNTRLFPFLSIPVPKQPFNRCGINIFGIRLR